MLDDDVTFCDDGAQLFRAALNRDQLDLLQAVLSHLPHDRAGLRLTGVEGLAPFLAPAGQNRRLRRVSAGRQLPARQSYIVRQDT